MAAQSNKQEARVGALMLDRLTPLAGNCSFTVLSYSAELDIQFHQSYQLKRFSLGACFILSDRA